MRNWIKKNLPYTYYKLCSLRASLAAIKHHRLSTRAALIGAGTK